MINAWILDPEYSLCPQNIRAIIVFEKTPHGASTPGARPSRSEQLADIIIAKHDISRSFGVSGFMLLKTGGSPLSLEL